MATYLYPVNPTESMDCNLRLIRRTSVSLGLEVGFTYSKLVESGTPREQLIIEWINEFDSHSAMIISLSRVLESLSFGVDSQLFKRT